MTSGRREAGLDADSGAGVFVGCMSETQVGIAAAAALASALAVAGASVPQDLDAGLWLTASPVEGGVAYEGESVTLPEVPGTGIHRLAS